jgi:hypothetical protein
VSEFKKTCKKVTLCNFSPEQKLFVKFPRPARLNTSGTTAGMLQRGSVSSVCRSGFQDFEACPVERFPLVRGSSRNSRASQQASRARYMDDSHPSAHYYFLFGSDDTYARRSPSIFNNDLGSARAKEREREKSAQWSLGPVLNVFMLESSAQEALYGIEFSHGERFEFFFISRTCTHKSKRHPCHQSPASQNRFSQKFAPNLARI